MQRVDLWFGKEAPTEKFIEKLGVKVLNFRASAQTAEYDEWVAGKKQGIEPKVRYLNLNVTIFDEELRGHVEKIWASYEKKLADGSRDPRPHIHLIGRFGANKKLSDDGKRYFVDFTALEASPLIFGPLRK
jgi:hypothetical protein